MTCEQLRDSLDSYLSHELPVEDRREVASHLEGCPRCAAELATRARIRTKLQDAVRTTPVPAGLEDQVRRAVRTRSARPRTGLWAVAAAAGVIICVSAVSLVRTKTNPVDAILARTPGRLAAVLKVGLLDHLTCAVFRKYPKQPAPANQLAADLGPQSSALLPMVQAKLPAGFYIVEAHHCAARGRQYTHIIMAKGDSLVSLILTRKQSGESVGDGIHQAGVDRFQVVGFESHGYLAYVISDMDAQQNLQLSAGLAPAVREFLAAHQG